MLSMNGTMYNVVLTISGSHIMYFIYSIWSYWKTKYL